jgi:hypothetical protein
MGGLFLCLCGSIAEANDWARQGYLNDNKRPLLICSTKQFLIAIVNLNQNERFLGCHQQLTHICHYRREACFQLAGGLIKLDLPIRMEIRQWRHSMLKT